MIGLIIVFGARVLGFAKEAPQMGILFICGSVGALVATLILPLLRRRFKPGWISLAGLALNPFAILILSFSSHLSLIYTGYALWNLSYILIIINGITLRQQLTPDELQGRVHASGRMVAWVDIPLVHC